MGETVLVTEQTESGQSKAKTISSSGIIVERAKKFQSQIVVSAEFLFYGKVSPTNLVQKVNNAAPNAKSLHSKVVRVDRHSKVSLRQSLKSTSLDIIPENNGMVLECLHVPSS